MFDSKAFAAKASRRFFSSPVSQPSEEPTQRRLMGIALALLLVALVAVLYHDRDFWFPDTLEADDEPQQTAPLSDNSVQRAQPAHGPARKHHAAKSPVAAPTSSPDTSSPVTITRTVLPPLEVEVVAGDVHRRIRPRSDTVKVDLQPESPQQEAPETPFTETTTAASVTDNAAERVQMSAGTSDVVSHSVEPGYPILARQMKVEGSVILLALIGRDGLVQDLRVLSGPPILATAAREAVRQWHFKPHLEGTEAVETLAKVTVNFTISTN